MKHKEVEEKIDASRVNATSIKAQALKGLTLRQKRIVQELPNHKSAISLARSVGYTKSTEGSQIYKDLKNPRIVKAIQMYYSNGKDAFVGDLACGNIIDLLTNAKTDDNVKVNASRLALQVAGKLKNINYNANINVSASKEDILSLLNDSNS
jgi:hypothetical protein